MIRNIVLFALVGAAFCLDEVVQKVEHTQTGHQNVPTLTQGPYGPVAGYAPSPVQVRTTTTTKTESPAGVPVSGAHLVQAPLAQAAPLVAANSWAVAPSVANSWAVAPSAAYYAPSWSAAQWNAPASWAANSWTAPVVTSSRLVNSAPVVAHNGWGYSTHVNNWAAAPLVASSPVVSSNVVHSASLVAPSVYGYGLNSPYLSAYNNYMLLKKK